MAAPEHLRERKRPQKRETPVRREKAREESGFFTLSPRLQEFLAFPLGGTLGTVPLADRGFFEAQAGDVEPLVLTRFVVASNHLRKSRQTRATISDP
jgi:hypothetical protein